MMVIGQNEITSKYGREALCVYVRDASVTRHLILNIFYDHYVFRLILAYRNKENYKALSDPLHINQFKGVLKLKG